MTRVKKRKKTCKTRSKDRSIWGADYRRVVGGSKGGAPNLQHEVAHSLGRVGFEQQRLGRVAGLGCGVWNLRLLRVPGLGMFSVESLEWCRFEG